MQKYYNIPKIWENETAYILGGGASIISQFGIPAEIVEKVRRKELPLSAYSEYMTELYDKNVIGVNIAFELGSWIDVIYFTDKEFLLTYKKGLVRSKATIITGLSYARNFYFCKVIKQPFITNGICTEKDTIYRNRNSGAGAINLAYHLGATKIVLIGFDGKMTNNEKHFHSQYKGGILDRITHPFTTKIQPYAEIQVDAKKLGIQIINTSLDSAITEFEKQPLSEIL